MRHARPANRTLRASRFPGRLRCPCCFPVPASALRAERAAAADPCRRRPVPTRVTATVWRDTREQSAVPPEFEPQEQESEKQLGPGQKKSWEPEGLRGPRTFERESFGEPQRGQATLP